MTMAILALLAYKAVKHIGGGQPPSGTAPAPLGRRRTWPEASAAV